MFKHPNGEKPEDKKPETQETESVSVAPETKVPEEKGDLRDLLEKNLKWSQIIYEQNRKINNKLLWAAIANWVRLAIIIIPLALALWFLPPFIKDFQNLYNQFFSTTTNSGKPTSIEDFIKILPLNAQEAAQLKAIIGNK